MEDSHGKDISLQCTTVKVPGMKPRGSRVVGAISEGTGSAISSDMDAMHLVTNSDNATYSNTTPGKTNSAILSGPKDKVCCSHGRIRI